MNRNIDRRALLAALAGTVLAGCGGGGSDKASPSAAPPPAPAPPPFPAAPQAPSVSSAVAVKWSTLATNAMLDLAATAPPGMSPMEESRVLAMAFLAGHDALNHIVPVFKPYRASQSLYVAQPTYAYEVAVATVLKSLMPSHAAHFQQALQESLTAGNVSPYSDEIELGEARAQAILEARMQDGSENAQGPYTPGTAPGDYQPTFPVGAATFVHWGAVRPFVLTSGDQFRAPPPHSIGSAAYATDFIESKSSGGAAGSLRTAEQSEIAMFWLESTPLSWQRILTGLIAVPALRSLWEVARLFALLQAAQADAYIACLESKYHYNVWRPITAIPAADTDGNPDTLADPGWLPFGPVTPPVPEYPSAHASAAAAGAHIAYRLASSLGVLTYASSSAGTSRTFTSPYYFSDDAPPGEDIFSDIAREIGLSRIYAGYHFRHAVERGMDQGASVGDWVLNHALGPA